MTKLITLDALAPAAKLTSFKVMPEMTDERQGMLAQSIFDPKTRCFLYINEADIGIGIQEQIINGGMETVQYIKDAIEVRFGRTAMGITVITIHIPEELIAKYGEERIDGLWKTFARSLPFWNTLRITLSGKHFDPMKIGRMDKLTRGGELPEGFIRKVMLTIDGIHFFDIEEDWLGIDAHDMAMVRNGLDELVLNVATKDGVYYRNLDFYVSDVARRHMFPIGNTTSIVAFGEDQNIVLATVNGRLIMSKPDDFENAKIIPALFDFNVIRVATKRDLVVVQTFEDGLLAKKADQLHDGKIGWKPYIGMDIIESTGKDQPLELVGAFGQGFLATAPTSDGTLHARRFDAPRFEQQQAM